MINQDNFLHLLPIFKLHNNHASENNEFCQAYSLKTIVFLQNVTPYTLESYSCDHNIKLLIYFIKITSH